MRNHTAFSTTTHNRPVLTTTPKPDTYPDGRRRVTMCSARCARNARGARAVDNREQRESSKMMCETSWGVPESKRASCLHAEGKGVNLQHIAAAACASLIQAPRPKVAAPLCGPTLGDALRFLGLEP